MVLGRFGSRLEFWVGSSFPIVPVWIKYEVVLQKQIVGHQQEEQHSKYTSPWGPNSCGRHTDKDQNDEYHLCFSSTVNNQHDV